MSKQVRQFFGIIQTHIAGEIICETADAHLALAELLVERGDGKAAAEHYDRLVALAPDNHGFALARAQLMLDLGLYPQAVDGLAPFADAEVPDPAAILLLAKVHLAASRSEKAIERYRQFLALVPDAPEQSEVEAALAELGG